MTLIAVPESASYLLAHVWWTFPDHRYHGQWLCGDEVVCECGSPLFTIRNIKPVGELL